jgi:hypothetical protein
MDAEVVTTVDATLPEGRERELLDGYRELVEGDSPDGLLRSELLRGTDGTWRIQTTWRDREAVVALRRAGQPPAALVLLQSLGAEYTHAVFTVEQRHLPQDGGAS